MQVFLPARSDDRVSWVVTRTVSENVRAVVQIAGVNSVSDTLVPDQAQLSQQIRAQLHVRRAVSSPVDSST